MIRTFTIVIEANDEYEDLPWSDGDVMEEIEYNTEFRVKEITETTLGQQPQQHRPHRNRGI